MSCRRDLAPPTGAVIYRNGTESLNPENRKSILSCPHETTAFLCPGPRLLAGPMSMLTIVLDTDRVCFLLEDFA